MLFGPVLSGAHRGADLRSVRADGFSFVVSRVSAGVTSSIPDSRRQLAQAAMTGVSFVGMHLISTENAGRQASNYRQTIGSSGTPTILGWGQGGGPRRQLDHVLSAFENAGINVRLICVPSWVWADTGQKSLADLPPLVASACPSNLHETRRYHQLTERRWGDYGDNQVAMLHFSDRVWSAGYKLDALAYPGTREQLHNLLYAEGTVRSAPVHTSIPDGDWSSMYFNEVSGRVWRLQMFMNAKFGSYSKIRAGDGPHSCCGEQTLVVLDEFRVRCNLPVPRDRAFLRVVDDPTWAKLREYGFTG